MGVVYPDDDEELLFNYNHPKVEKVLSLFGFDNVIECGGQHPYQIWAESTKQHLLFYFNARYNIWGLIVGEYYFKDDNNDKCDWSPILQERGFLPEFDWCNPIFQTTQDDGRYYGDIDDDLVCQWLYGFLTEFHNRGFHGR